MMDKRLTFAGYDVQSGPHIFPIEIDREKTIGHIKMARPLPPEIEQYIRTAKPIPGKTQLLTDAMGAGEFWGSNVNGDYFPEAALAHEGDDYGYRTFLKGHVFRNHVNKDPSKAYGNVLVASYDKHMHRVLLIITIDNARAADIIDGIAHGNYPDVSMGCRVPWDQCSICKNKARNRAEYCEDLKYRMNKILPDGRRVCAYNWLPKLFDISAVPIGAEKASHVLQKVASLGAVFHDGQVSPRSSAELGELYYGKTATDKKADIVKETPSNIAEPAKPIDEGTRSHLLEAMDCAGDIKGDETPLPTETLNALAANPLDEVFHTLAMLGIDLRPEEFQRIVLVKQGAAALADHLDAKRWVFDEAATPGKPEPWAQKFATFNPLAVSEKVAGIIRPFMEERSCYPEILAARLNRMEKRANEMRYDRNSQWHPMTTEQKRKSSGMSGLVPAALALAAGFAVFKNVFPQLMEKGPAPVRALARHPWLIPLLAAAGVGAHAIHSSMSTPRALEGDHGTGRGLDAMGGPHYDDAKTASIASPLARLGAIPAAYIYAGMQQRRWEKGDRLNAVDRFIASRPDLVAIAGFALTPRIVAGMKQLTKSAGILGDMAIYAVGAPSKFMPGVLAGALVDSLIFRGISRLAEKKKGASVAYPQ